MRPGKRRVTAQDRELARKLRNSGVRRLPQASEEIAHSKKRLGIVISIPEGLYKAANGRPLLREQRRETMQNYLEKLPLDVLEEILKGNSLGLKDDIRQDFTNIAYGVRLEKLNRLRKK